MIYTILLAVAAWLGIGVATACAVFYGIGYDSRSESDRWLAVMAILLWPVAWGVGILFGVRWLFDAIFTHFSNLGGH